MKNLEPASPARKRPEPRLLPFPPLKPYTPEQFLADLKSPPPRVEDPHDARRRQQREAVRDLITAAVAVAQNPELLTREQHLAVREAMEAIHTGVAAARAMHRTARHLAALERAA